MNDTLILILATTGILFWTCVIVVACVVFATLVVDRLAPRNSRQRRGFR